jgi:hypothetical protein
MGGSPLLDKTATLRLQNQPLEAALAEITRQTDIRFSYSPKLINVRRTISIDVKNVPVQNVLLQLLGSMYEYSMSGNVAILRKAATKVQQNVGAYRIPTDIQTLDSLGRRRDAPINGKIIPTPIAPIIIKNICISDSGIITLDCLIGINPNFSNKTLTEMKLNKQLVAMALASAMSASALQAQQSATPNDSQNDANGEVHPIKISLFYPFSYPDARSDKYTYGVSLNGLFCINGGVNYFEAGILLNINRYAMRGAHFAGIANIGLGEVTGTQVAGIANLGIDGSAKAQIAGITNVANESNVQIAGIVNAASETNVQMAGIVNTAENTTVQLAGIANAALKEGKVQTAGVVNVAKQADVQLAGIVNASLGSNKTQLAGIVNVADTSKVQVAGLLNVARRSGLQIGLVNIADTSSGISIGLLNIVRRGGLHEFEVSGRFLSASKNARPDISVAYRIGMPKLYSFVEVSYNKDLWLQGVGFGTQINLAGKHGLNVELMSQMVTTNARFWEDGDNQLSQLRVLYHYRFAKYFTLFGGPTLNFYFTDMNKTNTINIPTPYTIFEKQYGNVLTKTWVGVSVGVRL